MNLEFIFKIYGLDNVVVMYNDFMDTVWSHSNSAFIFEKIVKIVAMEVVHTILQYFSIFQSNAVQL